VPKRGEREEVGAAAAPDEIRARVLPCVGLSEGLCCLRCLLFIVLFLLCFLLCFVV
jgi:hypothetical protein